MCKDLIKWSELSRKLSGSDNSIRPNKVPKKYERKVNRLLWILDLWERWANNVNQEKRTVCPDCGDYGWIYSDDGTSRKTCACHY